MTQIWQQKIRVLGPDLFRWSDTGQHRNGANGVGARGENVGRGIPNQRDRRIAADPALAAGFTNSDPGEAGPRFCHFAKSSEAKISLQTRAFQFAPPDPGQISGDETQENAAAGEAIEQRLHARAMLGVKRGAHSQIMTLRSADDFRHGRTDQHAGSSGSTHHLGQDVGVEHSLDRNALRSALQASDAPHGLDEGCAVMRTCPADQCSIDIEQHQRTITHGENCNDNRAAATAGRRYNGDVNRSKFRIGLIQMACSQDPAENLAKAEWRIRDAAGKGAQIICCQELFRSQYFCREENAELFDLAEPVPGPTTESFARLARDLDVVIIGSVFERRTAGVYHNTAVVLDAGGALLGSYRKMHIPDDPLYFEKYYFTPGDLGFRCFDTRYARIAPLVCWDQWYPEAARLAALGGAQVLFYPTAIGWHPAEKAQHGASQHDAWRTIQRAHAIANGLYVAAVNRVGYEGPPEHGLEFWGGSFVADPFGQMLAEASMQEEELLVVECDPRRIEEVRRNWPFLRDRRIDAYSGIGSRVID